MAITFLLKDIKYVKDYECCIIEKFDQQFIRELQSSELFLWDCYSIS